MNKLQAKIKSCYIKWASDGKYQVPDLADCLDFMTTEVAEAIDIRLRIKGGYVRNNIEQVTYDDIAIEIFDAIMMGCIALDLLGKDLDEVANHKLNYMDVKRQ